MAHEKTSISSSKINSSLIDRVSRIVWGDIVQEEVFYRWCQGFTFSTTEPTALIQHQGGPCAVIAPIQGYLLKKVLFELEPISDLRLVKQSDSNRYLNDTLIEVLKSVSTGTLTVLTCESQEDTSSPTRHPTADSTKQKASTTLSVSDKVSPQAKKSRTDVHQLHTSLRSHTCSNIPEEYAKLQPILDTYQRPYGIILFMYSVILTKGMDEIETEVQDPGISLIDGVYGHGSQNLINLLLTGYAVSNVWDNVREVCGLKLQGINKQSNIGFLSYLEHLRYCEVGWYLKNPRFPIWLLASESHLTVLFSKERGIVYEETKEQMARRVFQTFDSECNGFVQSPLLGDLMASLDLVADPEYVNLMRTRLDSENLGIVTLQRFLDEFFPNDSVLNTPKTFTVYHYNGLQQSAINGQLQYQAADVTLEDEPDVQVITDTSPIKLCLQTKWPSIDIRWAQSHVPSLY